MKISKATAYEFRACYGGLSPEKGTADDWRRLREMAFKIQNDLVDAFKRHTPRSRRWARIGDEAKAMESAA